MLQGSWGSIGQALQAQWALGPWANRRWALWEGLLSARPCAWSGQACHRRGMQKGARTLACAYAASTPPPAPSRHPLHAICVRAAPHTPLSCKVPKGKTPSTSKLMLDPPPCANLCLYARGSQIHRNEKCLFACHLRVCGSTYTAVMKGALRERPPLLASLCWTHPNANVCLYVCKGLGERNQTHSHDKLFVFGARVPKQMFVFGARVP